MRTSDGCVICAPLFLAGPPSIPSGFPVNLRGVDGFPVAWPAVTSKPLGLRPRSSATRRASSRRSRAPSPTPKPPQMPPPADAAARRGRLASAPSKPTSSARVAASRASTASRTNRSVTSGCGGTELDFATSRVFGWHSPMHSPTSRLDPRLQSRRGGWLRRLSFRSRLNHAASLPAEIFGRFDGVRSSQAGLADEIPVRGRSSGPAGPGLPHDGGRIRAGRYSGSHLKHLRGQWEWCR